MLKKLGSWTPVRVGAYMAVCAVLQMGMVRAMCHYGPRAVLKENGLVEWIQVGTLACAGVVLVMVGLRAGPKKVFWLFLAGLAFVACFRELDKVIQGLTSHKFRKLAPCVIALALIIYALVKRRAFVDAMVELSSTACSVRPGAVLMVIGFMLAVVWAQVLGQRRLWRLLLFEYKLFGLGKRLVEEGLEACGYLLILCGAIDELICRLSSPRAPIPEQDSPSHASAPEAPQSPPADN